MGDKAIKIVNEARWADGLRVRNRLDDITYDPMRSQEDYVMRLMRENDKTAFGRAHAFEKIRNLDDFRNDMPLTSYDDYVPYIERTVSGKRNVLTAYLTEHISVMGDNKQLPQSRWAVQANYDYGFCAGFHVAGQRGLLTEGRTLNLVNSYIETLPSGMTKGSMLGRLLVKRNLDNRQIYAIPMGLDLSSPDYLYRQALHALSHGDISLAICERHGDMIELLRYIEKNWPKLAEDIEHGNEFVEADSERARVIGEVMEEHHIGTQLVTLLWPGLRCIMVFDVDKLSAAFELLRTYCGHDVHFLFTGINGAEGMFSATLNLDDPQTVLIPDGMFYEFKPKEAASYDTLVTLDQLEIGRSYELVVTTLSGLYRYKTQKTFLVVGRYHDTPTVIIDKD